MSRQPSIPTTSAYRSSVMKRVYDTTLNRPLQVRGSGIMRNRGISRPVEEPTYETNPKTDELIAKFLASHGLSYDTVYDRTFRDLIHHLNVHAVVPMPQVLKSSIEKMGAPGKPAISYAKTVGPISVTVDVTGDRDDHFLCFSIHYFEDFYERKNVVYLRKLMLSILEKESLLTTIRRAVNNYSYANIKFTNIVCPNRDIYDLLVPNDVVKRGYMCFHYHMSNFVEEILGIETIAKGIQSLERFVRFVRAHSDLYGKFRREQLTKNGDLDLPSISKGSWDQTTTFLTKCLLLHDAFFVFCIRCNITPHLTHDQYNELMYIQRILQQCLKHSRELSQQNTSISQVIPAIMTLKGFLTRHLQGTAFDHEIREAFTNNFQTYTSDSQGPRYNAACLLDPRSAFHDGVYAASKWGAIEKSLVEDFATTTRATSERFFSMDLDTISYEDRITMITDELKRYRQICTNERPGDGCSPFLWWGKRKTDMEILAVLACEFLACPAVSIDAKYFFSEGGKMANVSRMYDYTLLESTLAVSGINQKFHGRGAIPDNIPQNLIEQLNNTMYRRPSEPHLSRKEMEQYTMEAGSEYPPLPIVEEVQKKRFRSNEEESTSAVTSVLPSVAASMGLDEAKPTLLLNETPAISDRPVKEEEIDDGYATALEAKPSPPAAVSPDVMSETKASLINDEVDASKEIDSTIKSVIANRPKPKIIATQKRFIGQNAANDYPKPTPVPGITQPGTPMHTFPKSKDNILRTVPSMMSPKFGIGRPTAPIIINPTLHGAHPKSGGSGMQRIQPHNFVQKFTQQQQFVRKFPNGPIGPPLNSQKYKVVAPTAPMAREGTSAMKEPKPEPGLNFEVKQEPMDSGFHDEDFNGGMYTEMLDRVSFQQFRHNVEYERSMRKPCNRRCSCCNRLAEHENLKNVTIESEKMVVLLGAVYRRKMEPSQAYELLQRPTKTYICRIHFQEAVTEVFKMLKVNRPADIAHAKIDYLSNAAISVNSIYTSRHFQPAQLRQLFINFTEKYYKEKIDRTGRIELAFDPSPEPEPADFEEEILPKSYRQPRKQVLEADQHETTVKVIEQEDFRLPQADPSEHTEDCANPEECCFCLVRADRSIMLRVPKGEDRVARWLAKLGPEFGERMKKDGENYVCRSHFPDDAFSSRGRLLKGQLPTAMAKKVEVSYALDIGTGNFKMLGIQKSGTQKNSSIDLASTAPAPAPAPAVRPIQKRKYAKASEDRDYEESMSDLNESDSEYSDSNEPGPSNRSPRRRMSTRSQSRANTPMETKSSASPVVPTSATPLASAGKLAYMKPFTPEERASVNAQIVSQIQTKLPDKMTPVIRKFPTTAPSKSSKITEASTLAKASESLVVPKEESAPSTSVTSSNTLVEPKKELGASTNANKISNGLVEPKEEEEAPLRTSRRISSRLTTK